MRRPSSFGIGPHSEAHAACAEAPAAARTRPAAESRLRSEPTPRPLRRSDIPAVPFPPLFPWRAFNHRWKEMDKFPAEHPLSKERARGTRRVGGYVRGERVGEAREGRGRA